MEGGSDTDEEIFVFRGNIQGIEVYTQGGGGVGAVKSDKPKILVEANPSLIKAVDLLPLEDEMEGDGGDAIDKALENFATVIKSSSKNERSWPTECSAPQRRRSFIDPSSWSMDKEGSSTATGMGGVNTSGTALGGAKVSTNRWDVDAKTSATGLGGVKVSTNRWDVDAKTSSTRLSSVNTSVNGLGGVNSSGTGLGGAKVSTTRRAVDVKNPGTGLGYVNTSVDGLGGVNSSGTGLRNVNTSVTGLGSVNTSGTGLGGSKTSKPYVSAWDDDANTYGSGFGGVNTSSTGWGGSNAYAGWGRDANTYAAGLGSANTYATGLGYANTYCYGAGGGVNTYGYGTGGGVNSYGYGTGGGANTYGTGWSGANVSPTGWECDEKTSATGWSGANVSPTGWECDEKTSATGWSGANVSPTGWECDEKTIVTGWSGANVSPTGWECDEKTSATGYSVANTSASACGGAKQVSEDTPFVPERGFYQPSTEATWEAYQALTSLIEAHLYRPNIPKEVMCGVADEILSVLKSTVINSPCGKKTEIERILSPIPDFAFNELVLVANLITDYYVARPLGKTDDRTALFTLEDNFYQPKSEDSCVPYKIFLDIVIDNIGSQQPQVVQCVVAHEVLTILKNEDLGDTQKKVMLKSFLEDVSDDTYSMMLFIAGRISDFTISNGAAAAGVDANLVVNQDPSQNITAQAGEDGRDHYMPDQTNEIYDYGVDGSNDGSRESTPDLDASGTKFVYSSDAVNKATESDDDNKAIESDADNKATESDDKATTDSDDSKATTDSDDDLVLPAAEGNAPGLKLEFSSEDETLYYPDDVHLDENDVDGWLKVDFDDFFD